MVAASLGGDNYVVFSIHSSTCGRRADDFAEIQIKIDSRFGGKKFKIEIDSSIWREEVRTYQTDDARRATRDARCDDDDNQSDDH